MNNNHKTLRDCIESLIQRLESIKESNPEIHVDDDIRLARKALDDHWAKMERLMRQGELLKKPTLSMAETRRNVSRAVENIDEVIMSEANRSIAQMVERQRSVRGTRCE